MSVVVVRVEREGRVLTPSGWYDGYVVLVVRDGQPSTDGLVREYGGALRAAMIALARLRAAGDEVTLG